MANRPTLQSRLERLATERAPITGRKRNPPITAVASGTDCHNAPGTECHEICANYWPKMSRRPSLQSRLEPLDTKSVPIIGIGMSTSPLLHSRLEQIAMSLLIPFAGV